MPCQILLGKPLGVTISVAFSLDGKTLASGSADQTVKLWQVPSGKLQQTLSGHSGFVISVVYPPDGQTMASSGSEGTVNFWDPASG